MTLAVLLFFNIGGTEIFFILLIIVMMFGSKKIPELARGLGKGIREMKDAANGIEREITREVKEIKDDSKDIRIPPL